MKIRFLLPLCTLLLLLSIACGGDNSEQDGNSTATDSTNTTTPANKSLGELAFKPDYSNFEYQVPEGATVDILFSGEEDSVWTAAGTAVPANVKHDFLAYVPIKGSSENGIIFVNHELRRGQPELGQWGSMSWFEVRKENGRWQAASAFNHIDFTPLGGTWHNCGGALTPNNTLLTAEEYPPSSNADLLKHSDGNADTSDFNGLRRFENMGWMVEVDLASKKPMRKLYAMGRFSHEDAHCMPDGKTVYLTDDAGPGFFFKFEADSPYQYDKGTLYVYKQTYDGASGEWVALPTDREKLIDARKEAAKAGGSMFAHIEWVQEFEGQLYITESGAGHSDWSEYEALGATPAAHHRSHKEEDGKYDDPFGRLLIMDPNSRKLEVLVEGGPRADGEALTNPDGLTAAYVKGKPCLIVCEDSGEDARRRAGLPETAVKDKFSQLFFLELKDIGTKYTVNDLIPITAGPRGCEQTGPIFTPDGKTMFVSLQGPKKENPHPYNLTSVVAVTGIFEP